MNINKYVSVKRYLNIHSLVYLYMHITEFEFTHKGAGFCPDNFSLLEINLDRVRLLYLQVDY